jgi:hypothetical protein
VLNQTSASVWTSFKCKDSGQAKDGLLRNRTKVEQRRERKGILHVHEERKELVSEPMDVVVLGGIRIGLNDQGERWLACKTEISFSSGHGRNRSLDSIPRGCDQLTEGHGTLRSFAMAWYKNRDISSRLIMSDRDKTHCVEQSDVRRIATCASAEPN